MNTVISAIPPPSSSKTHPLVKFLPNEGLEDAPDHLEDERLLHHVHLLQPQRHRVLDEAQKAHAEGWTQRHDLLHGESVEVHDDHDASDLGFRFQHGRFVDEVEDSEELVRRHFRSVPAAFVGK